MVLLKAFAAILLTLSTADAAALLNYGNKKDIIPDSYIVILKNDTSSADFDSHVSWVTNVHDVAAAKRGLSLPGLKQTFDFHGFRGYTGSFDRSTLDDLLKDDKV